MLYSLIWVYQIARMKEDRESDFDMRNISLSIINPVARYSKNSSYRYWADSILSEQLTLAFAFI